MGVSKSSVAELLAELVAKGYVHQVQDLSDGRARIVVLAQRGLEAAAAARKAIDQIEADMQESIGRDRMRILRETLQTLNNRASSRPADRRE